MHTLIQLFIKFDHTMWDRHKAYRSDRTSDPACLTLGQTGTKNLLGTLLKIQTGEFYVAHNGHWGGNYDSFRCLRAEPRKKN